MKKIIGSFLLIALTTLSFVSCSDDADSASLPETTVSPSLRIALNGMVSKFIPAARLAVQTNDTINDDDENELCFDFVYPITLSYNDGTVVSVNSLDEIMELLQNETSDSYLNGIAFPFQIDYFAEGVVITVLDESDFEDLNLSCGDGYYDDEDIVENNCFELQFPFSLINIENEIFEVADSTAFYNLLENPETAEIIDFVYPINVLVSGEIVVVNNMFEFSEILSNCYGSSDPYPGDDDDNDDNDCICTTDYNPVCVVLEDGQIYTFANACLANCEGFDESAFVECE